MRQLRLMPHGTFIFDPGFGLCRLVSKAGGVATLECNRGTDSIERPLFFVAFDLPHFVSWDSLDEARYEYYVHHPDGVAIKYTGNETIHFWNGSGGWCEYTPHYYEVSKTLSMLFCRERPQPVIAKLPTYAEQQAAWLKDVDFKPGDKIKVLESADSQAKGWENWWHPAMDVYIGRVLTAGYRPDDDCTTGVPLVVDDRGSVIHFPFFVLLHHNEAFQEAAWAA